MKKLYGFILFGIFCLAFPFATFALETNTHKKINEHIATNTLNNFSLDSYLKNQLGFTKGIYEEFTSDKTKQVWEWVQLGGEYEDIPIWYLKYLRSVNHFHNPITNSGYSGFWGSGIMSGMSSAKWALLPQNIQSPGGYYSWFDVRGYYLKALTSSDQNTRNTNFAQTFRGLGQLMHLIQDASVPAHTRNDGHLFYNYEKWVEKEANISGYIPSFFSGTISNISSFIDTNQYNGTNPSNSNTIGLSEYTNANFFSEETINASSFPYPKIFESTPIVKKDFTNTLFNTTYPRQYYLKNCCGETGKDGKGYLLSAVDYLDYYRQQYPSLSFALPKIPVLDDNVYKDYATLLLPRAVGYSAGLLNYFFRGQMEANGEVAKDSSGNITGITIKVKNLTSNEDMRDGNFVVSYKYKPTDSNEYVYGLSDKQYFGTIPYNNDPENYKYTFNFPAQNPIPKDATDVQYILVFQGTLGSEQGAVVGRVVNIETGKYIYVIDICNHQVQIYDTETLTLKTQFNSYGFRIAVDSKYIYIVERRSVQIIDKETYGYVGQIPRLYGDGTESGNKFETIVGIAVDNNNIYIADWGDNNKIKIFNKSDYSFISFFGGSGYGNGRFIFLTSLATELNPELLIGESNYNIDSNNKILSVGEGIEKYRSGFGGGTISGITSDDNYIYFVQTDYEPRYLSQVKIIDKTNYNLIGSFKVPLISYGIAIDDRYIYISHLYGQKIHIFDKSTYSFVKSFGSGCYFGIAIK